LVVIVFLDYPGIASGSDRAVRTSIAVHSPAEKPYRDAVKKRLVCLVAIVGSCAGSTQASGEPARSRALVDLLPGKGIVVVGLSRAGSEKELADALAATWKAKLAAIGVPRCPFYAYAKTEQIVARIDEVAPARLGVFAARGPGLRAAVEGCLRSAAPQASIREEGKVTRYQVGPTTLYLVWLDDGTVIGGPVHDGAATAALADRARSAPDDSPLRPLVAHVDMRSAFWLVVDVNAFVSSWPANVPRPSVAWGQTVEANLKATAVLASAADAGELAALARERLKTANAPPLLISAVVIEVDGARLLVTFPIEKAFAQFMRDQFGAAVPSKLVPSVVALGPIAALFENAFRPSGY
jgi:hypothetical protein